MNDYKIVLGAILDANAKGEIQKALDRIEDLSVKISKAQLDPKAIEDIKSQLTKNGIDLKLVFNNTSQVVNQVKQAGQEAGKQFQSALNSAIQKTGGFKYNYDFSNNISTEQVLKDFQKLANGAVTVRESMENIEGTSTLQGFNVKIEHATGLVENLRYRINEAGDSFEYIGGNINDNGIIKQINAIDKHVTNFNSKLQSLKAKNTNALIDTTNFESAIQKYQAGTITLNQLEEAYNELDSSIKKSTANLKSQSTSFDPIQQALNNMRDMPSTLKALEASMNGVKDKSSLAGISVKDLKDRYTELNAEIQSNGEKVPLTDNWITKYREFMSTVASTTKKVEALKKTEASDGSLRKAESFTKSSSKKLSSAISKYTYGDTSEASAMLEQMNKGLSNFGDFSNVEGKINKLSTSIDKIISKLKKSHEEAMQWINDEISKEEELQSQKDSFNKKNLNGIDYEIKKREEEARVFSNMLKAQMQKNQSQMPQDMTSQVNKIQENASSGKYEADVQAKIAQAKQWTTATGETAVKTADLETALRNLQNAYSAISTDNSVANQEALVNAEKALNTELAKTTNEIKKQKAEYAKTADVQSLYRRYKETADKNTAMLPRYGKDMRAAMKELSGTDGISIERYNQLNKNLKDYVNNSREAGKLGLSFFDKIKDQASRFSSWMSTTTIIMRAARSIKQMVNNTIELDEALTNISYTMDASEVQLKRIGDTSIKTANELHTSTSKVLNAVKTYANAKETTDKILDKAKPTIMMSNVSGMDLQNTVDIIQGAVEQFQLDDTEEQLMNISDLFQTVSANMPMDFSKTLLPDMETYQ